MPDKENKPERLSIKDPTTQVVPKSPITIKFATLREDMLRKSALQIKGPHED